MRAVIAIAAAMAVASSPSAHAARYDGWSITAGTALSAFGGDLGGALSDTRFGPRAAVGARFRLGEVLSFQPELGWVSKGAHEIADFGGAESEQSWRLEYLETPLLVRADWRVGRLRPYALAGPSMALRVGGARRSSLAVSPALRPRRLDFARIFESISGTSLEGFPRWDFGATAGAGVVFGTGTLRLVVEGRYTHGLRDVAPEVGGGNRSLGFSAGIEMH